MFPALLLAPGLLPKLALLGVLGVVSSGWYAIAQARPYGELPNSSGTAALVVSNAAAVVAGGYTLLVGLLAERHGLGTALWGCGLAPPAILIALHRDPATRVELTPADDQALTCVCWLVAADQRGASPRTFGRRWRVVILRARYHY